jgi:diguanylate cyclase (GGDEF)-like protein
MREREQHPLNSGRDRRRSRAAASDALPADIPAERDNKSQGKVGWGLYRPGMSMRLAIGFLAVALVVVTANLVTQQSARTARERVRQLLVQHEPLVRATESLAAAVSHYERVIVDQSERDEVAAAELEVAAAHIAESLDAYDKAAQGFPEHEFVRPALRTELASFRATGDEVVQRSRSRRTLMREYWMRFDRLEAKLDMPQDQALRFAGAVFASESVMGLQRAISTVREKVSSAASVSSPRSAQIVVASETAFAALLKQHAPELSKFHGVEWVDAVTQRFRDVVSARRAAFNAIGDYEEQLGLFRETGADIASMVLTQLVEPARRALADADRLSMRAADKADRQLVWASATVMLILAIIAIVTVTSVTTPVRRLTEATRKVASGIVRTRVLRGGVRELDLLAHAFNQMAEQLEHAENEVRAYQAELEAKVDERTRELTHLAHHDPLTQLPNRRQLFMHLEAAIGRARSEGSQLAVLFIDLDNFKTINDSLGHAFGDSVLQAVSERLRLHGPSANAFSARFGGDEFTVICENVESVANVERIGAALLEQFQSSLLVQGRELRISVSVGTSIYPDHADNPHSLLRAADAALFHAKELGRSCARMFVPELVEAASSRFKVEQALRRAVQHGEFELLYQPQVCFESLQTHTVEALLRWRQPDGNVIAPSEFLEVAEQSGLISEISDWALRTAIEAAARWQNGAWPRARVAVNISSQQLLNADFVERLECLLQQHRLSPECLEIELTENVLQTGPATIATLHRLRELGVSIALDDFGTGYSSLTSLEQLPLSRVKIDRSLIASIDQGGRSPSIVRSIIGLCHSLGLQVTAEGVERPTQLSVLLTDRGVQVQGYLVSRPIAASTIPLFLAHARDHLESLMIAAPGPDDTDTSSRLRVLRLSSTRPARRPKGAEES